MKQISVLGCGWLGFPLAKSLIEKGFSINGATTSIEKIPVLKSAKIIPFQIQLLEDSVEGSIDSFLKNSEILILNIPPKSLDSSMALGMTFIGKIQNLIPFIEKSTVKKVLFVSSTSVYADDVLMPNTTEDTSPNSNSENGKQFIEAERLLQSNTNFKTTIIRFGGLIGDDRHPVKFLAGRQHIENPDAPINLIHQEDCIGIIETTLRQAQSDKLEWDEVFNVVAPFHPSRKEYYTAKALELNLPLPEFDTTKPSVGKWISSEKTVTLLGYQFKKPTL